MYHSSSSSITNSTFEMANFILKLGAVVAVLLVAVYVDGGIAPDKSFSDSLGLDPMACPRKAKILCSAHNYPPFNGDPIECDKPILCGDQHLFGREVAPIGVECEWDPENPKMPTKVCNGEGNCTSFYWDQGDC
ncbi:uncharacterized protein LOC135160118 [Diachasmimorpha longicaudata]|uniref:uncharacterized protein LOC135160118 n=1 Tax=Diachasmimorpha longicaudata TaxID=58733 RepID=UPI0030B8B92A